MRKCICWDTLLEEGRTAGWAFRRICMRSQTHQLITGLSGTRRIGAPMAGGARHGF